jgi:hypothetical protein
MKTECINWKKSLTRAGYGQLRRGSKTLAAHRVAWEEVHGPIPDGLWVLHHCDNRKCINVEHLYLGDVKRNALDAVERDRTEPMRGENNWNHKLTETQIKEIRQLLPRSTIKALARRFGVCRVTISRIKNNRTWKWLA